MTIHLCHQGQQLGDFSREQIDGMLNAGVITDGTLAWTSGFAEWKPLKQILRPEAPPPVPVAQIPGPISPPSELGRQAGKRVYLITLVQTLAAGLVGFVIGAFIIESKMVENPLLNALVNGLLCALLMSLLAGYVVAIVICAMKNKPFFAIIGVIGLSVPAFSSLWPIIGACRIAKPNSRWARKYYDERKMQIARARFPKD